MDIYNSDDERMMELRVQYEDEKDDNKKDIMRVSTRSAALIAGRSVSALQGEVCYTSLSSGHGH